MSKWEAVWVHEDDEWSAWGVGGSMETAAADAVHVGLASMTPEDAEGFAATVVCYRDPVWLDGPDYASVVSWSARVELDAGVLPRRNADSRKSCHGLSRGQDGPEGGG